MVTKPWTQELCLWLGNVHTDFSGWGGKREVTPAVFLLFSLDDAGHVHFSYFNCPQGPFHWRTLPSLSETSNILPHIAQTTVLVFF